MNIPQEISQIDVHYVRRISDNEYSSSCPRCGGTPHRSGEYPDRFRIWLRSRATGELLGWCRQCGYIWTPKGDRLELSKHQDWIDERKKYEEERKAKAERALEILHREQAWLRYHGNLSVELRHYYYDRKIDDFWIDYWALGYNPDKVIWDGETEYHTPALTIPVFEPLSETPINVRNRLLQPKNPADKYRPEISGLPSSLYFTDRDNKPSGKALLVEGEFKAMTTFLTLDDPKVFVVGTPGKTPSPAVLSALDECELVYLLLDPDAYVKQNRETVTPIRKMIDYFKAKSRVIQLPYKVDDMIASGTVGKKELVGVMNTARKIHFKE